MTDPEAVASNRRFIQAWEFWAQRSKAGEISQLPGLTAPWWNTTWPMCNLMFLSEAVRDEADLDSRAQAAVAFAQGRDLGWLLFLCREMLPEGLNGSSPDILDRHGLSLVAEVTGMDAESLLPPRRPLPDLELRRVDGPETRRALSEINALAYGEPIDWVDEALNVETLWGAGTFGYVGYLDGRPVTTAETIPMDGVLYVALVATLPEEQRKGYGEAVMRHSLERAREATGLERTVLHSSPAGFQLYKDMGYRPVASFLAFAAAGEH